MQKLSQIYKVSALCPLFDRVYFLMPLGTPRYHTFVIPTHLQLLHAGICNVFLERGACCAFDHPPLANSPKPSKSVSNKQSRPPPTTADSNKAITDEHPPTTSTSVDSRIEESDTNSTSQLDNQSSRDSSATPKKIGPTQHSAEQAATASNTGNGQETVKDVAQSAVKDAPKSSGKSRSLCSASLSLIVLPLCTIML